MKQSVLTFLATTALIAPAAAWAQEAAVEKGGGVVLRAVDVPFAQSTAGREQRDVHVSERRTLAEAHDTFRRWLGDDYDLDALDAVLATAAAERLTGDSLWLLLISGSGNAKTETVQSFGGAGAALLDVAFILVGGWLLWNTNNPVGSRAPAV